MVTQSNGHFQATPRFCAAGSSQSIEKVDSLVQMAPILAVTKELYEGHAIDSGRQRLNAVVPQKAVPRSRRESLCAEDFSTGATAQIPS